MSGQQPVNPTGRWSGIIGVGQSLGAGIQAPLPGMTQPVPHALKLNDPTEPWQRKYNVNSPDKPSLRVVPLNEPIHAIHLDAQPAGFYPWNIAGKTPHSAMAAQITAMLRESGRDPLTTVHTCVAHSGEPLIRIRKGGATGAYRGSMYEATALTRLAKQERTKLEYDALILTHGETDAGFGNQAYENELCSFHSDYIRDLQAITGQKHAPILILSQQNTCPTDPKDPRPSPIIQAQWRAQLRAPNLLICAGPKYQYGYHPDGLHFVGTSYDRLGEKYGEAYVRTVVEGRPFSPVAPTRVSMQSPQVVRVDFNVPHPPLQWDEKLWWPHRDRCKEWANGRGFEVKDSHGRMLEIRNVQINDDKCSVNITLSQPSDHFPLALSYAMSLDRVGTNGGRPGGRVGHLCDSDPLVGASAERIKVKTSKGSHQIECCDGKFARRAVYDLVEGGAYTIVDFDDVRKRKVADLDRPWDGADGEKELFFQHNHRNYCVSFAAWVRQDAFGFDLGGREAGNSGGPFSGQSGGSSSGVGGFGFKEKLHGLFHS